MLKTHVYTRAQTVKEKLASLDRYIGLLGIIETRQDGDRLPKLLKNMIVEKMTNEQKCEDREKGEIEVEIEET